MRLSSRFAVALAAAGLVLGAQDALAQAKPAPAKAAKVAKPTGDAAAGAKVFASRCVMCHTKDGGGGPMAPSLKGVYGVKAASGDWAKYSAGLKASGLAWSEPTLDTFLAGPTKMVPGSRMMVTLPKPEDRKNVIAYLATLKK